MKRLLALLLPLWLLTGAAAAYDGQDAVFARFPLSELAQYAGTSESDWLASALAERGAEGADVYADALTANLASGTARILFPTDGMRIAMTYKSLGSPKFVSYLGDSVFYCTELGKRGVGDFAWALIAAEHCGTSFPSDAANTPESLLQSIAEAELESGGFALMGNTADADATAIVLRALAPYRESCSELVERTLNALAELQRESGAFASLGTETAESTAQVVLALSALGIAPDSDERFVKNGVTCIDALYGFATSDGFAHISGGETDALATAQALSALRAYELPQQNDDSVPASAGAVPSLSSAATDNDSGTTQTVLLVAAAVAVVAGAAVFLRVRFAKQYQK